MLFSLKTLIPPETNFSPAAVNNERNVHLEDDAFAAWDSISAEIERLSERDTGLFLDPEIVEIHRVTRGK